MFALLALVLSATGVVRIAVAPIQADQAARSALPSNIDDIALQAVQVSGRFEVVGKSDIQAMLDHEADKQTQGCTADSCLNEVAAALGVDQLVSTEIAHLDDGWVVTSKLIDVAHARVLMRQRVDVQGGPRALSDGVVTAVRRLFDPTWQPPEKPLVTPSFVASVGTGVLVVGAAGSGVWALSSLVNRNGRFDAYEKSTAPVDVQAFNDAKAADSQMWLATYVAAGVGVGAVATGVTAWLLHNAEVQQ